MLRIFATKRLQDLLLLLLLGGVTPSYNAVTSSDINPCRPGYPNCEPDLCDQRGILPSSNLTAPCQCKIGVRGRLCDRCKRRHFGLSSQNPEGCERCECSDVAATCSTTKLEYGSISALDSTWRLADFNAYASEKLPSFNESTLVFEEDGYFQDTMAFWLAPPIYSGNRRFSYGTNITFTPTWRVSRGDISIIPINAPNVVLISNDGQRIAYMPEQNTLTGRVQTVPLLESGWFRVRRGTWNFMTQSSSEYRGVPVARRRMLHILTNLQHIMIRSLYRTGQVTAGLRAVSLGIGWMSAWGEVSPVEQCDCPKEYSGLFCESCASGYKRIGTYYPEHDVTYYKCVRNR